MIDLCASEDESNVIDLCASDDEESDDEDDGVQAAAPAQSGGGDDSRADDDGPPKKRARTRRGGGMRELSQARIASLVQALRAVPSSSFFMIDIETTGRRETDEPIQVSIVNALDANDHITLFIMPSRSWSAKAEAVHNISKEYLIDQGAERFGEGWPKVVAWLKMRAGGNRIFLVGHNVWKFDEPMLRRAAAEAKADATLLDDSTFIDTMPLAEDLLQELDNGYSLEALYKAATSETFDAHDAYNDNVATRHVWAYLADLQPGELGDYAQPLPALPRGARPSSCPWGAEVERYRVKGVFG